MTVREHLVEAAGHASALRATVGRLKDELGLTVDVQRLRDDVARLVDDLDLIARMTGHAGDDDRAGAQGEIVFIPDDDYDPALWSDVEDEGLGHR
ncbi:MAG TPA: hypothetical protein VFJ97_15700 [Dermatophilaceae bacterium]|nr:hypothetical protein [Dermatophilaceae bacterium]